MASHHMHRFYKSPLWFGYSGDLKANSEKDSESVTCLLLGMITYVGLRIYYESAYCCSYRPSLAHLQSFTSDQP